MFSKKKTSSLLLAGLALSLACNTVETLISGATGNDRVPRMAEGVISAGWAHACALTGTGKVRCWGYNEFGQVGDGTTENRNAPVEVAGLPEGITAVSAGFTHSCALTAAGGVKCWGNNEFGQLGNGTVEKDSPVPVDAQGLGSGVKAISASASFTCALLADGSMKCWGANTNGQLGNGGHGEAIIPVTVKGLTEEVTAMATSKAGHVCAILKSGGLMCWGWNESGQLGNGSTKESTLPSPVKGVSDVAVVALGYVHTCVLERDGEAFCWGEGESGQLDDPAMKNSYIPVAVSGLPENPIQMAAGGSHTCVLTDLGEISCWGANDWGQLGNGEITRQDLLSPVAMAGGKAVSISAGGFFTCALMEGDTVFCWGGNDSGQLGDGTMENRNTPVSVLNLPAE